MSRATFRTHHWRRRAAFTLIELLLSLGLIALITVMIGYLVQLYMIQQEGSRERVEQVQVARGIINTIADDIRGVIRYQVYDASVLAGMMTSSAGGGAGGGGGGGGGAADGPSGAGNVSGAASETGSAAAAGGQPTGMDGTGSNGQASPQSAEDAETELPPGIYGTQDTIQIDVSRIPRPDQYFQQNVSSLSGNIVDIPSDLKSVTYLVQGVTQNGVQDPFLQSNAMNEIASATGSSGLVRREIDRNLLAWANSNGQIEQLNRTGELLGPEVVSLGFSYFDGTEWLTSWDSSVSGLPVLVRIRIALRPGTVTANGEQYQIAPGTPMSMITPQQSQMARLQFFETQVAIPGALLQNAALATGGDSSGMESVGL